ncbi:MAG: hypothetical protein ACAF41_04895 [Leptolyngbya sp. BL-A-14]
MADLTNDLLNLARQTFGQLTDADKKLFDAVARHEEANFKSDADELNQPDTWEQWGVQRTLKADRLVWLVTTPAVAAFLSFRGLRLTGPHIESSHNALSFIVIKLDFIATALKNIVMLLRTIEIAH